MISENLSLFLLVIVLSVIGCVILFRIYLYIIDKYFMNQFTWLLQTTVFRNYRAFKFTAIVILFVYFCIAVYTIVLTSHWYYGLSILGCLAYLVFKIIKSKKEGKLNFREDFNFHRYSTKVSYYNNQPEEYRKKSFESIIDKIKRTKLHGISNKDYQNYLSENFLSKVDQILTFEYYDAKLYNSISDHYTATLFYRKFLKNVMEILSRIDRRTNGFGFIEFDFQKITDLLLDIKLLDFDDIQGYHYIISLLDNELDEILKEKETNSLEQYRDLLKFKGDAKKIYKLFEKYLELKYGEDKRLNGLKAQFIVFVNFFSEGKYYESPSINDFETEDIKHLIGFFAYLNGKDLVSYKVPDLVYLVLKITKHESEINNSSFIQAHRNERFKLSEDSEKSLNARYGRLFNSQK